MSTIFQLSYLKNSLAIISAVARLYPFFRYPCTIVTNIPLTISSSISQYACIFPDKTIATYSIGLLPNNLCSFASDCSVVLRAASTYSQHISICKPHLNISVIHVISSFHDIIHSIIFHLINPSFPLSCHIRPVILPYLLFCTLLFLYLTNNRINLLRTSISLHTLQIISLFLQQLCHITHILNLALVKLRII